MAKGLFFMLIMGKNFKLGIYIPKILKEADENS